MIDAYCDGRVTMKTILVVDDDPILNKNISLALSAEGYHVLNAFSAEEAFLHCQGADLILLDVMLPDDSGLEFCTHFREISNKPVIFLTSCSDEADIIRGLDCGGDDYITKPFRLRELLSRIKANLRRIPDETGRQEDLPELTALEEKLLSYLMENKEQYLTREQILRYLWDVKGCFVNDNTLSVNISRLRDKLKVCKSGKIVTKRGLGYKWTE